MLYIGIIGCGWITNKVHIPTLKNLKGVNISAVFDTDINRVNETAEVFSIKHAFNDDIMSFFACEMDAVIIASPNFTHAFYAELALERKKHVLCEKPVCISNHEVYKIKRLAVKNNRLFIPAFVNRFREDVTRFIEILRLNIIGEIKEIECNWIRKSGVPRPGTWITNKKYSGGGVLQDLGSHVLDIALYIIGNKGIANIHAENLNKVSYMQAGAYWCESGHQTNMNIDVERSASGTVQFKQGPLLKYEFDWDKDISGDSTIIKCIGTDGEAKLESLFGFSPNYIGQDVTVKACNANGYEVLYRFPRENNFSLQAFFLMHQYFIHSIIENRYGELSVTDGIRVVELIESLYRNLSPS